MCPVLNPYLDSDEPKGCFLGWHNDTLVRKNSSSGGIFSAIADAILKDGGIVWGAAYDQNIKLVYQDIQTADELSKLRGSKYVQCEVGDAFLRIKDQLLHNRKVLFCGTPCHVKGLLAYIPTHLQERLVTVDFVCHGVPSPKFFAEYLKWLEQIYGKSLSYYNFREPKYSMNYSLTTGCTFTDGKHKFISGIDNSYIRAFEKGYTLRDCCYHCKSNGSKRQSDFTLADAFGGEKIIGLNDIVNGASIFITNTQKGLKMMDSLNISFQEIPLEIVIRANSNYVGNFKSGLREMQTKFYADSGLTFDERVQKWMKPSIGENIKVLLYNLLGAKIFYWLKNL